MTNWLACAQLGRMHEAFHAGRKFDEGTELLDPHDLARELGSRWEFRAHIVPGIACHGLERKRNPLGPFGIVGLFDAEDLHIELLPHGQDFTGTRGTRIAKLGNVQHAFDATKIDEGAEILDR